MATGVSDATQTDTAQSASGEDVLGFVYCIEAEKPGAPDNYRAERMRLYLAGHGETDISADDARFRLMIAPTEPAPLVDASAYPEITERIKKQHDARMACALSNVDRQAPGVPGETVESDEFSCLNADFNGYPERTAVLRRTTNYGQLLYIFPNVTVDATGRLVVAPSRDSGGQPTRRIVRATGAPLTAGSVATKIAKGVAEGMVSAIGGAIMGAILEQVFPPGVPSYFDQVYEEMKKIVGAELQQSTVDQVNGAINNIKVHLATEYKPNRAGKDLNNVSDRQFLFGLLQKYETTYLTGPGGMLGTLMDDKFSKIGLGVFMLGAGLHLALYQEMANVDPTNKDANGKFRGPLESAYGRPNTGTVAMVAQNYAAFADKVWPPLLADRLAKIHRNERVLCAFGDTTGSSCRYYAWFRDDLEPGDQYLPGQWPNDANKINRYELAEKEKNSDKNPGRDRLIQAYDTYVFQKSAELKAAMNDPATISAEWKKLIANPIKVS